MYRIVLCIGAMTLATCAFAQKELRVLQAGRQVEQAVYAAQTQVAAAVEQTVRQAYRSTCIDPTLWQGLFTLREHHPAAWDDITASAFVIEDNFNGKKRLWGVTATHYLFLEPVIAYMSNGYSPATPLPIHIEAQGDMSLRDVSLFPLPDEVADFVVPLRLAAQLPALNETVYSLGYFAGAFRQVRNRRIKEITNSRILTTFEFAPDMERDGACGGPVLNQNNEVVGLHCGSNPSTNTSFVIPATRIKEVLAAYHEAELPAEPLLVNGHEIGRIHINEHIRRITARRKDGESLAVFKSYHHEKELDYAHLERMVDLQDADEMVLIIIRMPFSAKDKDQEPHAFMLIYDLKTGEKRFWKNDLLLF